MTDLDQQISRYLRGDPDAPFPNKETAERNHDAVMAAAPWLAPEALAARAEAIVNENASVRSRRAKMIALIDAVNAAVAPYAACRRGCSHCCHIPAVIFTSEAEAIAQATGRPLLPLPRRDPEAVRAAGAAFTGTPCPFLVDAECSIYAVRPFTCRQHHSLDDTPAQCSLDVPSERSSVPALSSVRTVELPYAWMLFTREAMGDIREFFPPAQG